MKDEFIKTMCDLLDAVSTYFLQLAADSDAPGQAATPAARDIETPTEITEKSHSKLAISN